MAELLGSRGRAVTRALVLALFGVCAWNVSTASAIPAFARKYQTSCQTCHTVFPKLNAFGDAFRLNGYRMPAETEEMVKEKPVSLGAPAYKKLWPKAVWPGEISSARAAGRQHQVRRRQHVRAQRGRDDDHVQERLPVPAGG